MLSLTFLTSLLLGSVALAAVPIPDNDPFYQPPAGFGSSAPGAVFKNRVVSSGISGVTATQILYRTTDANGNAAATVATILKGSNSDPSKLVIFNDYEDAANTTCAPSYLFNSGNPTAFFGPTFGNDVTAGLAKGWTLVIADYEGFTSAFSAGRLEGHAVLDALRATKNYAPAGISANAVLGGYGYSGGAIATGWAAALHPTYAPELNIKGWAFGGTPANVTSTLIQVSGTIFAGFAAAGIAGQIKAYPEANTRFNQIATAAGQAAIAKALTQCALDDIFGFLFQNILTTQYQTLGANLLYDPVIQEVLQKGQLGLYPAETPSAPVFMYHGVSDEVIPYASAKATADSWCANGAQVTFLSETGGTGHLGTSLALYQNAVDWLDARITGQPLAAGCNYTSDSAGGLGLKRGERHTTVIEEFGVGDSVVISKIMEQIDGGGPISGFWSYLRN